MLDCFGLEAEAESESASRRGVLRRGEPETSSEESTTVGRPAVKALEVVGSDSSVNTSAMNDDDNYLLKLN